jgi:hypothetical protein
MYLDDLQRAGSDVFAALAPSGVRLPLRLLAAALRRKPF